MNSEQLNKIVNTDFLYHQLPGGFISFKPDGTILKVNETLSKWMEISMEEIYKLKFRSILTKACGIYFSLVIEPILNIKVAVNEIHLKILTPAGSFDALFNAVSHKDQHGNTIVINATIQQITDRKRYETELLFQKNLAEEEKRRFEFISNSVPNQIWTSAADGEFLSINQKAKSYFGKEDLPFFSAFENIYLPDREKVLKAWKKCLTTGKRFEREARLKGLKSEPEWFFLSAEPYINEDGSIDLWFGSSTNIHKKKSLQIATYSALKSSLTMAQTTLDENAEHFVNIAMNHSHMIRKPLANIIGLIALLKNEVTSEEGKSLMKMLEASTEELDNMILQASIKPIYRG